MPKFSLFRKKKEPEQETKATAPSEEPKQEAQQEPTTPAQEPSQESITQPNVQPEVSSKTYLKAMPLRELADVEKVKNEVSNGNIIILRVTPLASKSIEDVKTAVNELYHFAESTAGDIARLGEERVVICPKSIRIWREKTPTPVSNEPVPTAA